jgi:hypothetical protein
MKGFRLTLPRLGMILLVGLLGLILISRLFGGGIVQTGCLDSQVYCPGVGCISGSDKCVPGSIGGPSRVFSKETFTMPTAAKTSCRGGTRTDGPCLMSFA